MTVPADGQLSGLYYLPSHQEAATSTAWARPSLEGDKTQQSLNALMEGTEKREKKKRRLREQRWRKQGQKEEEKYEKITFLRQGGGKIGRCVSKHVNKCQIKIQSKRTDIVVHRLKPKAELMTSKGRK